ncbi:MAG: tetratricopeptide repeat protein, partial [Candidatus Acidiferrales bacterium]
MSGSPIRGVRLQLMSFVSGGILTSVDSDRDGRFVFLNLRGGGYQVLANHPSYEDKTFPIELYAAEANVRLGMTPRSRPQATSMQPVAVWALKVPSEAAKEFKRAAERLQKKEFAKAIQHLQAAVAIYPQHAGAYSLLGTVHLMLKEPEKATGFYQRALEIDDQLVDACLGLAALYTLEKRFEEAEQLLLRARSAHPGDWRVHFELGELYTRMEDWPRAEDNLRKAKELHPPSARLLLLLVNALAWQEEYGDTLEVMEEYLRLFPRDS